jgi:hypothetical protein
MFSNTDCITKLKEIINTGFISKPWAVTQSGLSIDPLNAAAKRWSYCGAIKKTINDLSLSLEEQDKLYLVLSLDKQIVCFDSWSRNLSDIGNDLEIKSKILEFLDNLLKNCGNSPCV